LFIKINSASVSPAASTPVALFSQVTLNTVYNVKAATFYETENDYMCGSSQLFTNSTGSFDFTTYLTETGTESYQVIVSPLDISSLNVKDTSLI
jgi:hypothetical protein